MVTQSYREHAPKIDSQKGSSRRSGHPTFRPEQSRPWAGTFTKLGKSQDQRSAETPRHTCKKSGFVTMAKVQRGSDHGQRNNLESGKKIAKITTLNLCTYAHTLADWKALRKLKSKRFYERYRLAMSMRVIFSGLMPLYAILLVVSLSLEVSIACYHCHKSRVEVQCICAFAFWFESPELRRGSQS